MKKILVSKIRCKKCGDIIESKSVHAFKFCKCEAVAVDGGHDYLLYSNGTMAHDCEAYGYKIDSNGVAVKIS